MIIERLTPQQTTSNIRTRLMVGSLAFLALGIAPESSTSAHRAETLPTTLTEASVQNINGMSEISEVVALRKALVKARAEQAARDALRQAIASPVFLSSPTATPSPSILATHSPKPETSHNSVPVATASPLEIAAIGTGQYWFGTDHEATKKFTLLGEHAHQIAQLEYTLGKQQGLPNAEIGCTQELTVMESGNNELARNPSSGAYGLGQALPANKMASKGADWATNPTTQVEWELYYTELPVAQGGRYGSPCITWNHWVRYRSY